MGQGQSGSTSSSSAVSSSRRHGPIVHVSCLASGDIILLRRPVATAIGSLDAGLVRAMVASQRGGYFSAQQQRLSSE